VLTLDPSPFLAGWDASPGLIALHLEPDGAALRLYHRRGEATVTERLAFSPFLLVAGRAPLAGQRGLTSLRDLEGPGALRVVARFATWSDALAARDRCRALQDGDGGAAPLRFFADPAHQYLLLSGRTSFGGLRFADLRRLALDIEVVTTEGFEFPNAAREGDRIVAVALADSRGFRHVVRGDRLDEAALIQECGRLVHARDPDVIEGHNIFRFDLAYLEARARRHRLDLAWGRDGSSLRARPSRLQVAERSVTFPRYEVAGRHVVDTWLLAQLHDVGARDLPSFGLKDIARHLGVAAENRTYVDASAVARELREAPDRLMAYALDDAVETLAVSRILSAPYFAQAQVVPLDYQATALRGAAAKIDALLLRESLRRGRAIPVPRAGTPVGGGYTAVFMRGVARPVLHVDVTSLYPSLMLARGIAPASDDAGVFLALLGRLRDFRVRAKRLAREATGADERAHLGALQQSFKILINAFYGYLAFGSGHWNDYAAANRVTDEGRGVVTAIIEELRAIGAVPLEADTDGVYFVPPAGHAEADDEALVAGVAAALPDGLQLELDGRYAAMLSYKMKTYGLLDSGGRVILKGSAFRSRGLEPFQRGMIQEIVRLLLEGRARDVKAVIERWSADFQAHRVPVRLFARTETLHETLEAYREKVREGARAPSAAYELALRSDTAWQPGDQLSYYVTGRSADVSVNDHARRAALWDPARPDENVEYYHAKAQEIWGRFKDFAERDGLWPAADGEGTQLSLY
jgi:DNA polymerase elongation subunit (family B)